jgi:DNA-binding transcriptional LysR family regulator
VRLNGLDLNLLVALDALLEEQQVTRAGERVGLTQSAMSDALGRLRRHYDDELLVRRGNRFHLTPLGEALRERVSEAINSATYAFGARAAFDPASSTREFRIFATGIGLVVVRPLLDRLSATAPRVSLSLLDMDELGRDDAEFRRSDGAIGPRGVRFGGGLSESPAPHSGIPCQELYRDEWMLLSAGRAPDPAPVTLRELRERPWVSAYGARSPVMRHLMTIGFEPTIVAGVQDFAAVPFMVTGTNRVAALPHRFAALCARHADLRIEPFPVPVPPLVEAFWWHPNHVHDAGHQWFREELAAVVVTLNEVAGTPPA